MSHLRIQAVVLLYINPKDKQQVLSVSRKGDYSQLGLPGGKNEEEETHVMALCRECSEELGVELDPTKLVFVTQDIDTDFDVSTYLYTGILDLPEEPWVNSEDALVSYVPAGMLVDPTHSPFSKYNLSMFEKLLGNLDFIPYLK